MTEDQQSALMAEIDRVMQLRRIAAVMDRNAQSAAEQALQARTKLAAGAVNLATMLRESTVPPPEAAP